MSIRICVRKLTKLSPLVFQEILILNIQATVVPCARLQPHQIYCSYNWNFQLAFYNYFCQLAHTAGFSATFLKTTVILLMVCWWVGSRRWVKPSVRTVWASYWSQKCQPQVQTCLNVVNGRLPIPGVNFTPMPSMQHPPWVPLSQS